MNARRRDIVFGLASVAVAVGAWGLRPRRSVSVATGQKLGDLVPLKFGTWTGTDVSDLTAPDTPDSLTSRLYDEVVQRVYTEASTGHSVMVLLAHGPSQTEELQLHRPEQCYPAFGYAISNDTPVKFSLAPGVGVPARQLVAHGASSSETVVYWVRYGEHLPTSPKEQQLIRVSAAMRGAILDGLLVRFSVTGDDLPRNKGVLDGFIPRLVAAVPPDARKLLVGSALAADLQKT